jgi:hypothetical protein
MSMSIPSNPYSDTICVTEFTRFGMLAVCTSVKYSPPPPSEISTFFPWPAGHRVRRSRAGRS